MPLRNPDTTKRVLNDFLRRQSTCAEVLELVGRKGAEPSSVRSSPRPQVTQTGRLPCPRTRPRHHRAAFSGTLWPPPQPGLPAELRHLQEGDPGRPSRLCGSQPQIGVLLVGACSLLLLPSFFAPILHTAPCPHWSQPRCLLPSLASPPFCPGASREAAGGCLQLWLGR